MKKILAGTLLLIAVSSQKAQAQDYKFGLGLRLSTDAPSISNSITARYFLNQEEALEGMLSFGSRFGVGLLYEKYKPLGASGFKWFYGAGAYVGFQGGDTYLGPAGIIGLDYKFTEAPVNISLDWKPELDIIPKVNLIPDAFGLSARYTF
ncbi:MAG: hypothetical protein H7Y03_04085 [Chitinophagaceae bacterium]|nr:hypothetical protein [Chitinophagaceae bacterium]